MTAPARIELLTEAEAARLLHISARTLRDLRGNGKIHYIRMSPRRIGYHPDDLVEYIERQRQQDEPPCPSTNQPKANSGTTTSGSKVSAITEALAARRNGTRRGSRQR